MANIKSAEKRHLQSLRRRSRNRALRSTMRNAIKKLRAAVLSGDEARAQELLPATLSLIDATRQKGIIHRNTAARRKSRLVKLVRGVA